MDKAEIIRNLDCLMMDCRKMADTLADGRSVDDAWDVNDIGNWIAMMESISEVMEYVQTH